MKACFIVLVLAASLPAQQPAFEVASVKPALPGPDLAYSMKFSDGGRFDAVTTPRALIRVGYSIHDDQIIGGPEWLGSDMYAIAARAEGNPATEQMRVMLQSLLKERFHLVFHRETREVHRYALVIAKSGIKVRPSPPGEAARGTFTGIVNSGRGHIGGVGATMTQLAGVLSMYAGRSVTDKTSLAGAYDFTLVFAPAEQTDMGGDESGPEPLPTAGSVFTALQEQLGLKLVAETGPTDVLVIDRIEKPSEN